MDFLKIANNARMFMGFIIMIGGVYGSIIGKFDMITMLIVITAGIIFSETAGLHLKLKEIEAKIHG